MRQESVSVECGREEGKGVERGKVIGNDRHRDQTLSPHADEIGTNVNTRMKALKQWTVNLVLSIH